MRTSAQVILKMLEIEEQLKASGQSRSPWRIWAEGFLEALTWIMADGGSANAGLLKIEETLSAILTELQKIGCKIPGLPAGPETR